MIYFSDSLIFDENGNDGHPDKYRVDHLCYPWCLLVYFLFCHVTSPFLKLWNGVMVILFLTVQ